MLFFSCMATLHSSSNYSSFLFPFFSPSDSFAASTITFFNFTPLCLHIVYFICVLQFLVYFLLIQIKVFFVSHFIYVPSLYLFPGLLSAFDSLSLNVTLTKKWSESQLVCYTCCVSLICNYVVNLVKHVGSGAHPCSFIYPFMFEAGTFNDHIMSGC